MSNSLRPYRYWIEDDVYYFDTPSGARYFANFIQYPEFAVDLFTFNFDIFIEGSECIPDTNVFDTICTILQEFFHSHANALLVICDSMDGREAARKRLFNSWYLKMAPTGLTKIDREGKAETYNLFVSLFVWDDNPEKEKLIALLDEYCAAMLI